mmetsp:Transcript_121743/g.215431  ORF Transcript_121743/g.215431 Transcript_121743/m.215431 type:complete len:505 (+) Transcript_121743:323-1837(+)
MVPNDLHCLLLAEYEAHPARFLVLQQLGIAQTSLLPLPIAKSKQLGSLHEQLFFVLFACLNVVFHFQGCRRCPAVNHRDLLLRHVVVILLLCSCGRWLLCCSQSGAAAECSREACEGVGHAGSLRRAPAQGHAGERIELLLLGRGSCLCRAGQGSGSLSRRMLISLGCCFLLFSIPVAFCWDQPWLKANLKLKLALVDIFQLLTDPALLTSRKGVDLNLHRAKERVLAEVVRGHHLEMQSLLRWIRYIHWELKLLPRPDWIQVILDCLCPLFAVTHAAEDVRIRDVPKETSIRVVQVVSGKRRECEHAIRDFCGLLCCWLLRGILADFIDITSAWLAKSLLGEGTVVLFDAVKGLLELLGELRALELQGQLLRARLAVLRAVLSRPHPRPVTVFAGRELTVASICNHPVIANYLSCALLAQLEADHASLHLLQEPGFPQAAFPPLSVAEAVELGALAVDGLFLLLSVSVGCGASTMWSVLPEAARRWQPALRLLGRGLRRLAGD